MTRRQRRVAKRSATGSAVPVVLSVGVGAALLGTVFGLIWLSGIVGKAPDLEDLREIRRGQNSVVFAGDGSRLGLIDSDEVRRPIPLSEMPPSIRDATVAIEDERFYEHNSVDIEGGFRALVKNVSSGEIAEGGSTITMQLMRNIYLVNPKRDLERKVVEAKLAVEFEKTRSKDRILEKYLNTAPYGTNQGRTAIGVDAAARVYFSARPSELTLAQAALIAGLPQAPSTYNPILNPEGAMRRRNSVLRAMLRNDMVTEKQANRAINSSLGLEPNDDLFDRREPLFFDYVESELISKFGFNLVRRGGLRIYTTLDPRMQRAGTEALDAVLTEVGPAGALVAVDPTSGEIKAMASSAEYGRYQYNLATQGKRQPGSTFKTFTLAAAIREGMDPASTFYESKPLDIQDPEYGPWQVATYGDTYSGTTSVSDATLTSDNSVYAQLALDVGPEKVADMARDLGIQTELNGYPAETLGGLETGVSPLEMVGAYSTIASGGLRREPSAIRLVEFPDGTRNYPGRVDPKRVLSEAESFEVTKILQENMTAGTGTGASTGCEGQAGKTGTTDNYVDAWFVGYQPNLAAATWVGYPESNEISMPGVAGGTLPADIWNAFIAGTNIECLEFETPSEQIQWSDSPGSYEVPESESILETPSDGSVVQIPDAPAETPAPIAPPSTQEEAPSPPVASTGGVVAE